MRKVEVRNAEIKVSDDNYMHIKYFLNIGDMYDRDGIEVSEAYGVCLVNLDTNESEEVFNITTDADRIFELINLLADNEVTPLTVKDIVEDWI